MCIHLLFVQFRCAVTLNIVLCFGQHNEFKDLLPSSGSNKISITLLMLKKIVAFTVASDEYITFHNLNSSSSSSHRKHMKHMSVVALVIYYIIVFWQPS